MKKMLIIFISLSLGACATVMDRQSVLMTVNTPGAENARCLLENKNYKTVAYSGQTVEVMKSPYDLVVRCKASGNREQTVLVKREVNGWVVANVANGFVPGATYDVLSRGVFDYPDAITVNFAGQAPKQYSQPDYMNLPEAKMERYGSGVIETEANKGLSLGLQKKEGVYTNYPSSYPSYSSATPTRPIVSYDPTEEDK